MELKVIKPVDSTARSAAISKYSPEQREGGNSGQRQQSPDSYKPKTEEKEMTNDFDKFFASTTKKPSSERSEFELLFKKAWEENNRMQETAKTLEQTATDTVNPLALEGAWIWGLRGNFRTIKK